LQFSDTITGILFLEQTHDIIGYRENTCHRVQ